MKDGCMQACVTDLSSVVMSRGEQRKHEMNMIYVHVLSPLALYERSGDEVDS